MVEGEPRPALSPEGLRRLLRRLEASGVEEIEIVRGSVRLRLRREPGTMMAAMPEAVPHAPDQAVEGLPVLAPLTGVVYTRPGPDEPPFVTVGETVEAGDVVALIETMKLFNEVTADISGRVLSVIADEGTLVQSGQPLLYLEPFGESEEA